MVLLVNINNLYYHLRKEDFSDSRDKIFSTLNRINQSGFIPVILEIFTSVLSFASNCEIKCNICRHSDKGSKTKHNEMHMIFYLNYFSKYFVVWTLLQLPLWGMSLVDKFTNSLIPGKEYEWTGMTLGRHCSAADNLSSMGFLSVLG